MKVILVLCIFVATAYGRVLRTGCPFPDEIKPCVCNTAPFTILFCQNLTDAEEMRQVFINSEGYSYFEVHVEYSTLQYLPHDMFEKVPTTKIYLKNVTLGQLFDSPPDALGTLDTLYIEDTRVIRGIIWELMEPLKSLRILSIYTNTIRTLGKDFSQATSKSLEQLSFYDTGTKSIQPGTFDEFGALNKLEIDACKITELKRDIFPRPFLGSVIYFNYNQISSIADDMFADMPNLQTLGLINNQIATLPESAFSGSGSKLEYLRLDGNPLKCDCRIAWLLTKNIPDLRGECSTPKELHGRQLKDLTPGDLRC